MFCRNRVTLVVFCIICCVNSFSLAASEDVQYFQFDSEGNMFIFEPGSGFSGPAVKVEPGFEMQTYTQENWFRDSGVVMSDGSDESAFALSQSQIECGIITSTGAKR